MEKIDIVKKIYTGYNYVYDLERELPALLTKELKRTSEDKLFYLNTLIDEIEYYSYHYIDKDTTRRDSSIKIINRKINELLKPTINSDINYIYYLILIMSFYLLLYYIITTFY